MEANRLQSFLDFCRDVKRAFESDPRQSWLIIEYCDSDDDIDEEVSNDATFLMPEIALAIYIAWKAGKIRANKIDEDERQSTLFTELTTTPRTRQDQQLIHIGDFVSTIDETIKWLSTAIEALQKNTISATDVLENLVLLFDEQLEQELEQEDLEQKIFDMSEPLTYRQVVGLFNDVLAIKHALDTNQSTAAICRDPIEIFAEHSNKTFPTKKTNLKTKCIMHWN